MAKEKKIISEKYMIQIYLDNEKHLKALEYIKLNMKYAYILHDKDINLETGELKKEHIHIVVKFDNAREIGAVAKEVNIEENMISVMNSFKYAIRYLIHQDQKEKAQYEKENVQSNIIGIERYFKDKSNEGEEVKKILEFIYSKDRYLYNIEVLEYVIEKNIYSTYRRSGNILNKIIDEHNKLFLERRRDTIEY